MNGLQTNKQICEQLDRNKIKAKKHCTSRVHVAWCLPCVHACLLWLSNVQPDDFIKDVPQGLEKNDLIVVKGFFYPEGNR